MATERYSTEAIDTSALAQPLRFESSGKTAKNRFLKSAMSECLSTWSIKDPKERGIPTPELINLYKRWGEGGAGVIVTGNTMTDYHQLEAAGNAIIPLESPFSGERFEAFKELATQAKKQGSLIICEISHPGRQVPESINPHPIAPSDVHLETVFLGTRYGKPKAMEGEDIEDVIARFAHASEYCHRAGYDGVQLQAAHGYLLGQFLAPSTNKRTDQYGGSLANRSRIIFEIIDAIRARVSDPSFIISLKLNSVEFQKGGFSPEDCRDLCARLDDHGVDFAELSGGTYECYGWRHMRDSTRAREAFFLEFAKMILPQLKRTKGYLTGGFRTAKAMVHALETAADGIGLARAIANELDLPKKIISGEISGVAKLSQIGDDDLLTWVVLCNVQFRLVGNDKRPIDIRQAEHCAAFFSSMEQWMAEMAQNKDGAKYGFFDVQGIETQPYSSIDTAA